jgi:hypothetical protein
MKSLKITEELRAKKRRGLVATPEPPLGGWRSLYPALITPSENLSTSYLETSKHRANRQKPLTTVYNNYLIFLPIVKLGLKHFQAQYEIT